MSDFDITESPDSKRKPRRAGSAHSAVPRERRVPQPKDGSEISALPPEGAFKVVFMHAGRLVSIKDWSRSGLAKRLAQRFRAAPGVQATAQAVADKMVAIGAIDDRRFSRGFLRAKLAKRSLSAAARELAHHGVDKDTIEAAIEELRSEGLIAEGADQALSVWRKKFERYPADDRERAKQSRYMASRGFSYEALSKIWAKAKAGDM